MKSNETGRVSAASPVTARAVAIGLLLAVGINLVMDYSDMYLKNTLMIGNHFPTVGMAVLLLFIFAINPLMRRWTGKPMLEQGELLLVWSMVGVAGGIGATGCMRYIPGWAAAPTYFTSPSNEYTAYLISYLPKWMFLGEAADANAVRWFFEGLPRGEHIPWGSWLRPLSCWLLFASFMYAVLFSLTSIFYQQWTDRERLIFPVTYLPLEMTREPAPGKIMNVFLANRLVWVGAAVPIVVYFINGLKTYFPVIPAIPLVWSGSGWFPDRPWSELDLGPMHLYFSIIGITFLLTTEVSFSIVFFYLLYRLSFVYVAYLGSGATGFWGSWDRRIQFFQASGSVLVVAGFLFWSARRSLGAWLRRAKDGTSDAGADILPARFALGLLVVGFGGMIGWMLVARVHWWAALLGLGLFLAVLLVLTRVVAEAGLLMVANAPFSYDFLTGLVPASWVAGPTATVFMMQKGIFMHDVREFLMPFLMNGIRACALARMHARKVLGVLALTVVVAMAAAAYGRISTCYKYGGVAGDDWANLQSQLSWFPDVVDFHKNPPPFDWVLVGEHQVIPVNAAHVAVGAVLTVGMLIMRAKFLWWPLNPFGYILCSTYAIVMIWFSIMLGCLAKWSAMTFGGSTAYRKALPFFMGLVLGESIIAVFWIITSLFTGLPGLYVLPD